MTPTLPALLAELRSRCDTAQRCLPESPYREQLTKLNSDMFAHIDALEVDARRYRWLRDPTNQPDDVEGPGGTIIVQAGYLGDETILTGTELDAALDAALAEQGEPK